MKTFIQVVGTNSVDSSPSIILNCESKKYLFNCGEGSQRTSLEYKIRYSKLENIFTTSVNWKAVGGLPGMLLTLAKAGNKHISIHGPRNLSHTLAATRNFVFRMASSVSIIELDHTMKNFRDENVEVQHVLIVPEYYTAPEQPTESLNQSQEIIEKMFSTGQKISINLGSGDNELAFQKSLSHLRSSARQSLNASNLDTTNTAPSPTTIAYIIQGNKSKGKFDPALAKNAGAEAGPDFNVLHDNKALELKDGSGLVFPFQVMSPHTSPGSTFIILECPSIQHIHSLTTSPNFTPLYACNGGSVCVIIHIVNSDLAIWNDPRYVEWREKFGAECQHHKFSSQASGRITYNASAMHAARLNMIDSSIFPVPYYSNAASDKDSLKIMTKIGIEPKITGLDFEECRDDFDHIDPEARFLKKLQEKGDLLFPGACDEAKARIANIMKTDIESVKGRNDVQIITLGTAAAVPSRYRNVSSTVLELPGDGFILFDAGEGTYGQLFRRFGPDGMPLFLKGLKCIFISHMHADHHIGAIKILIARREEYIKCGEALPTLWIIAPLQYFTWINEYNCVEDIGHSSFELIESETLLPHYKTTDQNYKGLLESMSLEKVTTVSVEHCAESYAIVIKHPKCKIVFSGDCRPSLELIHEGKDADVLIHEATFVSPNEQKEAEWRRHSSVQEAIIVGKRMNAKMTLLNHFSNRYPTAPVYEEQGVGVAFDLMSFTIGDMHKLEFFSDALSKIYAANVVEEKGVAGEEVDLDDIAGVGASVPERSLNELKRKAIEQL